MQWYHGSIFSFHSFSPSRGCLGNGVYLTNNEEEAKYYASPESGDTLQKLIGMEGNGEILPTSAYLYTVEVDMTKISDDLVVHICGLQEFWELEEMGIILEEIDDPCEGEDFCSEIDFEDLVLGLEVAERNGHHTDLDYYIDKYINVKGYIHISPQFGYPTKNLVVWDTSILKIVEIQEIKLDLSNYEGLKKEF